MIPKDTKELILDTIGRLGKASVTDVVKSLPQRRSRQWVSVLLTDLHAAGKLARVKSGRFVYFALPTRLDLLGKKISESIPNEHINEDIIFENLSNESTFIKQLPENVNSILRYAFTEMVNNVRDHSQSEKLHVSIEETDGNVAFEVLDDGVGVFNNIMQKKHLRTELEAIQELLKGKTTTLPHSHSGEGIFFTSKVADIFILDSYGFRLRVDNSLPDVFVEKSGGIKGTKVTFELNKRTKKHLSDVFFEYEAEPGSFAFDKTQITVKLFKAGTLYISRSQAKRLLANLDKFALIILDFQGIETVGQAFADEVFHVFQSNHPNIKIEPINMSGTVTFMINRVEKPQLELLPQEDQDTKHLGKGKGK